MDVQSPFGTLGHRHGPLHVTVKVIDLAVEGRLDGGPLMFGQDLARREDGLDAMSSARNSRKKSAK